MIKKQKDIFKTILFAGFLISGCGYTTRSMLSNTYSTIYVAPFSSAISITNETDTANRYKLYRPGVETRITQSVISRFLLDGNLKPDNKESADLVLKGELSAFERQPLRYTENDEIEEYRINLVVNISLWNNKENILIWEEKGFTGDTTYFVDQKSEVTAINEALSDIARRIVERTVEEW
jgi:hypothetical protein